MQPANMTPQQDDEDLVAKSRWALNNFSTEGVDASIHCNLCHCWTQNPQADLNDIKFQVDPLLSIQEASGKTANNNQAIYNAGKRFNQKPWNGHNKANVIDTDLTVSTPSSKCRSMAA